MANYIVEEVNMKYNQIKEKSIKKPTKSSNCVIEAKFIKKNGIKYCVDAGIYQF